MAREIVYCDGCGRIVLPSELENGSALELARGALCKDCLDSLPEDRRNALREGSAPRHRTPNPKSATKSPFTFVREPHATTRKAPPVTGRSATVNRTPLYLALGLGGGLLVGVLVVVILVGGSSERPADVQMDVPGLESLPPVVTVREAPPDAPVEHEPPEPIATVSESTDRPDAPPATKTAAARLAEIEAMITPELDRYDDIIRGLRYFPSDYEGAPEVGRAKALLARVKAAHGELAEKDLVKAISIAEGLVAQGKKSVAVSTLRGVKARFRGSAWFTDGGADKVDEAIASLGKARQSSAPRRPSGSKAVTVGGIRSVGVPHRTTAKVSFATEEGHDANRLIDGNPQTFMSGRQMSAKDTGGRSSVFLRFPAPLSDLVGIETGKSDVYHNYAPTRMEFHADTNGDGEYDTQIGRAANFGGGVLSCGEHLFANVPSEVHGLEIRVWQQVVLQKRGFTMGELWLLRSEKPGARTKHAGGLRASFYSTKGWKRGDLAQRRVVEGTDMRWHAEPAPGIPKDNWSARLSGELRVPQDGTYHFKIKLDDRGRAWIAGELLGKGPLIEKEVELEAGWQPIKIDVQEDGGICEVVLEWRGPGFEMRRVSGEQLRTLVVDGPQDDYVAGLLGEYFAEKGMTPSKLKHKRIDESINFTWGAGPPMPDMNNDDFAVRWSGELRVPEDGEYTFYLNADDFAKLLINGKEILEDTAERGPHSTKIQLEAGWVPVEIQHFEAGRNAYIQLEWDGPGLAKKTLGSQFLRTRRATAAPAIGSIAAAPGKQTKSAAAPKPQPEPVVIHGAWAEVEDGSGHHDVRDFGRASGGKFVGGFQKAGQKVNVDLHLATSIKDAYLYLRYSRGSADTGGFEVRLGPRGGAKTRQIGPLPLANTGEWGVYRWTSVPVGDVEPGVWRIAFLLKEDNGGADLDIVGLVPGEVRADWSPPSAVAQAGLFAEARLASLIEDAQIRKDIVKNAIAQAETNGYEFDLVALVTVAEARKAGKDTKEKSILSFGGPVVASRYFDASLRKKLSARDGYRIDRARMTAKIDAGKETVARVFLRYLSRAKPEVALICFDESQLHSNMEFPRVESNIYACTSLALRYGAVPVLFTMPAYTGPAAESPGAVTKYNDIVRRVARQMHVPYFETTRTLNRDDEALQAHFNRAHLFKPAAFDAVGKPFLELHAKLEKWVLKR